MFEEIDVLRIRPAHQQRSYVSVHGVPSWRRLKEHDEVSIPKRLLYFGIGICDTTEFLIFDLFLHVSRSVRKE
jgi:hypothetical protein